MSSVVNKVKKAVIPVAGLGTRMLPATKTTPKAMLPLADKPLIQYVVSECIAAGISEIILVTNSYKNSIKDYFDTSFPLESTLKKHAKHLLLREIQAICSPFVAITQVRQKIARGLGNAVFCAYRTVGDEPVAVILPDVIINKYESNLEIDNLAAMLKRFEDTGRSQILVKSVDDVSSYGVVDCQGKTFKMGDNLKIVDVVEKPVAEKAPSDFAVIGRYVFSNKIWGLLKKNSSGARYDIQLTDAIAMLVKKEIVEAYQLRGLSYDCGDKLGYMQAFVEYSLHHENFGKKFKKWLKTKFIK